MNIEKNDSTKYRSKVLAGSMFILFGVIMLVKTFDFGIFIPDWIVSWPMILVVAGVLTGIRHQFRRPAPYFMIGTGLAFLAERIFSGVGFHSLIFPFIILAVGLHLIFGKANMHRNYSRDSK